MKTHRLSAALAALVLTACGQAAYDAGGGPARPVLADARVGGTAGFWFLPPIAPEPEDATPNHRGLAPAVQVEELAPGTAGVIARFEEVGDAGAHYQADWPAGDAALAPGMTYRISVELGGVTLGFADAEVAEDGSELRFLYSQETFPLTGERTLPIKFRIAEPAPDADGDRVPDSGDDCPSVPDPVQVDGDADGIGDACECLGVTCPEAEPAACRAAAACNPQTGACEEPAQPDGTSCDDGDPCTSGDGCVGGLCVAGAPLSCEPLDECHLAGSCDPALGACSSPAAPDGTACTLAEGPGVCASGQCVAPVTPCGSCGGCVEGCTGCTGTSGSCTTCGGATDGCTTCGGDCGGCPGSTGGMQPGPTGGMTGLAG